MGLFGNQFADVIEWREFRDDVLFMQVEGNDGARDAFFGEGSYPARSAVEVARLPKDALVEIEVTALLP